LFTRQVGEEYLLKYALDFETQGSATRLRPEALVSPFDYRLNLFDGTEIRSKPVDLPETFHYLIGLKVESRRWIERKMGKAKTQRYLHVTGTANGDGKRVVVVWRTVPEDWKEADYQAEKEWARETGLFDGADRGWYNGPGTFLGAHPLDAEFRRLLFA
jgi:adenine-specific DNA-methyltransferase